MEVIRDGTLIEKDIWRFLSIVFALERTNQLSLLPDKDLVDLCPPIEPYQVTKNPLNIPQVSEKFPNRDCNIFYSRVEMLDCQ